MSDGLGRWGSDSKLTVDWRRLLATDSMVAGGLTDDFSDIFSFPSSFGC